MCVIYKRHATFKGAEIRYNTKNNSIPIIPPTKIFRLLIFQLFILDTLKLAR